MTSQLISLTCGAHGLNLTAANRAIVYDHWWHECLERQAFARIHRIGQTKPVYTAKLVVKGPMDEDILRMQDRKRARIAYAVGDGTDHSNHDDLFNGEKFAADMPELGGAKDFSDDESGNESGGSYKSGSESDDDDEDDEDEDEDFESEVDVPRDQALSCKPNPSRRGKGGDSDEDYIDN